MKSRISRSSPGNCSAPCSLPGGCLQPTLREEACPWLPSTLVHILLMAKSNLSLDREGNSLVQPRRGVHKVVVNSREGADLRVCVGASSAGSAWWRGGRDDAFTFLCLPMSLPLPFFWLGRLMPRPALRGVPSVTIHSVGGGAVMTGKS